MRKTRVIRLLKAKHRPDYRRYPREHVYEWGEEDRALRMPADIADEQVRAEIRRIARSVE